MDICFFKLNDAVYNESVYIQLFALFRYNAVL